MVLADLIITESGISRKDSEGGRKMKCEVIKLFPNSQKKTDVSFAEFTESDLAKTPFGKLFIDLVREDSWAVEYRILAHFPKGSMSYLIIEHAGFLPGQSQVIMSDDSTEWTVRMVEDTIRERLTTSKRSLEPGIRALKGKQDDLQKMIDQIDRDKARAAVVSVYPEAASTEMARPIPSSDLCVFCTDREVQTIFVVRKIDGEFVGGVARIGLSLRMWYGLGDGVGHNQKHGMFFIALARAFAAQKLDVPERNLALKFLVAKQHPKTRAAHIERVSFSTDDSILTISFDNQLPATITLGNFWENAPSA